MTSSPIVNAPNLYVNNLTIGNFSTTAVAVAPGLARDSTNTNDLSVSLETHVSLSSNGLNGLDQGTVAASSFYALFIIGDSTSYHPTGFLLSLNPITPALPFGYDLYRRIGWVKTNGSLQVEPFNQYGNGQYRKYYYQSPLAIVTGGTATSFTTGTLNLFSLGFMPPLHLLRTITDVTMAISELTINSVYTASSATNDLQFANFLGATSAVVALKSGVAAVQEFSCVVPSVTGGSGTQVSYKVVSGDSVNLNLAGYTDSLF